MRSWTERWVSAAADLAHLLRYRSQTVRRPRAAALALAWGLTVLRPQARRRDDDSSPAQPEPVVTGVPA